MFIKKKKFKVCSKFVCKIHSWCLKIKLEAANFVLSRLAIIFCTTAREIGSPISSRQTSQIYTSLDYIYTKCQVNPLLYIACRKPFPSFFIFIFFFPFSHLNVVSISWQLVVKRINLDRGRCDFTFLYYLIWFFIYFFIDLWRKDLTVTNTPVASR